MVCQFAAGILLARMMGPDALGVYALAIAFVQVAAIIAQFGFPASLVRLVSVASAHNDPSSIRSAVLGSAEVVALISAFLIISAGIAYWTVDARFGLPAAALLLALLLVPLQALTATLSAAIRGLGYVIESQIATEVVRSILLLLMLAAWWVVRPAATPEQALLLNVAALAGAFAVLVFGVRKRLPQVDPGVRGKRDYTTLVASSFPFVLLAGAQVINYQMDVLLLGVLTTREEVGLYRVALQLADGAGVALFAISIAIAPTLARLQAQADWRRLRKLLVYAHAAATALMLPLGLGIFGWAGPLLELVYGGQYRRAAGALGILAVAKVLYAMVCFSGVALSMAGKPYVAALISFITIVLNVTLNLLLIPSYGMEGAAIATGTSEFIVNAIGLSYLLWVIRSGSMAAPDKPTPGKHYSRSEA